MAGKRQATSELNHDNWDLEEDPEERGTFRTATEDELKSRIIKKAKRKITPDTGNDTADGGSGTKSIFSGFSGFGKHASADATPTTSSPFSFLNKIPAVAATASGNVSSSTTASGTVATFSFNSTTAAVPNTANTTESSKTSFSVGSSEVLVESPVAKTTTTTAGESAGLTEYYKKLSCLNQAVCEWVKNHVSKNPICILSPIFKDYEKYLADIEKEKNKGGADETKMLSVTDMGSFKFSDGKVASSNKETKSTTSETVTKTNGFSFGLKKPGGTSSVKTTSPSFSFGLNSSATMSTSTTTSSFSFGNPSNNPNHKTPPKPFSFTPGGTPFSFGNIKPPEVSGTATAEGDPTDEEEEPPKNEFKQVVENDAVYSKKCKVFVKKDGSFVDKGVGTLYLKPVESSGRTQLLVRADTNLGNVLVNLILNSTIPTQRMGKNNVMMVCLPTPDVEKPTSMLLRVKTSEQADELLENIDKYKK